MGGKRLYRSERDVKICGLCGGLADYFNIDPTLIRLIVAAVIIFSGGSALVLYIIACLVVPKESEVSNIYQNSGQGSFYRSGPAGPTGPAGPAGPDFSSGSYYRSASADPQAQSSSSHIDEMMKEVEKKALEKEIEELRKKLAQYENNQKSE